LVKASGQRKLGSTSSSFRRLPKCRLREKRGVKVVRESVKGQQGTVTLGKKTIETLFQRGRDKGR